MNSTTTRDSAVGRGMVLTTRDRQILVDLATFSTLTRQQLQRLGHFGSKTRANAVLLRLVRFHYLTCRRQPTVAGNRRAVYMLGPRGLQLLSGASDSPERQRRRMKLLSDLFLEHQLLVNDVRLGFHNGGRDVRLGRWLTDASLRDLRLEIVPDGYAEYETSDGTFAAFIELDRGTE